MQTHDTTTVFCDDLIVERQSDELAPAYIENVEVVKPPRSWNAAKWIGRLCWGATTLSARSAFRLGCYGTRQVSGIADAIRWASAPRQHKKAETPTPGLMLEFVLLGIHIVVGMASLLV